MARNYHSDPRRDSHHRLNDVKRRGIGRRLREESERLEVQNPEADRFHSRFTRVLTGLSGVAVVIWVYALLFPLLPTTVLAPLVSAIPGWVNDAAGTLSPLLAVPLSLAVAWMGWGYSIRRNRITNDNLRKAQRMYNEVQDANDALLLTNARLALVQQRYHSIVESHDLVVMHFNNEGVVSEVNQTLATTLHGSPETWTGKSVDELIQAIDSLESSDDDDLTQGSDANTVVARHSVGANSEQRLMTDDGERWIRWEEQPIYDADGHIVEYQYVGADITYRKMTEVSKQALLDQDREARLAKSRFIAMVSHEIRTPLNGVLGMIELLLNTDLTTEQLEYANAVRSSGTTLLSLIEEILDLSSVDAGKFTIENKPFNLEQVLMETSEVLAPRANAKGLDIAIYIDPHLPIKLLGDAKRIKQILINLAGNAIKFTQRGGVTLEVRRFHRTETEAHTAEHDSSSHASENSTHTIWKSMLEFCVRDTGVGMSDHDTGRVFEDFEQADNSHTNPHGGTGLGLSISRRLAESMRGTIDVESKQGTGSVFSAILPLVRDTESAPHTPPNVASLRALHVLVCCRLQRQGELIALLLKRLQVKVILATDVADVRLHMRKAVARKKPIDIVIVSRTLENEKAEVILKRMVPEDVLAYSKIVALTTLRERYDGEQWVHHFDAYVTVPHTTSTLLNTLIKVHQEAGSRGLTSPEKDVEAENETSPRRATVLSAAPIAARSDAAEPVASAPSTPNMEETSPSVSTTPRASETSATHLRRPPSSEGTQRQSNLDQIHQAGKVVLAEDNAVNARVTLAFLSHLGVTAAHVPDGKEAVEWFEAQLQHPEPIALVLTDIRMPEMDGLEVTRHIRKLQASSVCPTVPSEVPIVALTANASDGDRQECYAAGVDAVLVKPIDYVELQAIINKYVAHEQPYNTERSSA